MTENDIEAMEILKREKFPKCPNLIEIWKKVKVYDTALFQWKCYGEHVIMLDGTYKNKEVSICFNAANGEVCEISEATENDSPNGDVIFNKWINPYYVDAYTKEMKERGFTDYDNYVEWQDIIS